MNPEDAFRVRNDSRNDEQGVARAQPVTLGSREVKLFGLKT